jgi:hypothetical protein
MQPKANAFKSSKYINGDLRMMTTTQRGSGFREIHLTRFYHLRETMKLPVSALDIDREGNEEKIKQVIETKGILSWRQ